MKEMAEKESNNDRIKAIMIMNYTNNAEKYELGEIASAL